MKTFMLSAIVLTLMLAHPLAAPPKPSVVYVSSAAVQTAPRSLVALDAESLEDVSSAAPLDVGTAQWAISGDGTTLVSIEDRLNVVVRDAASGIEGARFPAPDGACCPRLSYDGTRLILLRDDASGQEGVVQRTWYALEIPGGRVQATVRTSGGPWEAVVIDASAERLYRLGTSADPAHPGPWPVRIAAFSLTTGTELDEAQLQGVTAGTWPTDRSVRYQQLWTAQVWATQSPGVALSPDGASLAVVHADGSTLTVVDTETLSIKRTVAVIHLLGLLEWIGLSPIVAEAKGPEEGSVQSAVFGPDGRHVYTWGLDLHVDDNGGFAPEYRGLRVIDAEDGAIQAEALAGTALDRVAPAADGRSVYVSGTHSVGSSIDGAFTLMRLDAASLTVQAQRDFPGYRALRVRPVTPGDW